MSDTQKAILFSFLGFFLFSAGDILRKIVLLTHSPTEIQLWASSASVFFIILASNKIGDINSIKNITKPHIHLIKALLITTMMLCSIFSLNRLSLDAFYTLAFTAPIITSLLAAIFMKEHLTTQKFLLIVIGFLGVLVIARPNSNIDTIGIFLVLLMSLSFSINSLLNKLFKTSEAKFPFIFFPYSLAAIVFFIINKGTFPDLGIGNVFLCCLAGASSSIAMLLHVHAFQLSKAAVVAPYQYFQLVWGIIFGFILFGNMPDIFVLSGASIIIVSGLLLYFYDTKQKKN